MFTREYKGHLIEMPSDGRRVIDGIGVCLRCGEYIKVYYTRYGLQIVAKECKSQDQQDQQDQQKGAR